MRLALLVLTLLTMAPVMACAPARSADAEDERIAAACGEAIEAADSEFSTFAWVDAFEVPSDHNRLMAAIGKRIRAGLDYAVVDEDGYVGTLRATEIIPLRLAIKLPPCATEEWSATWSDPPSRPLRRLTELAFGPVHHRFPSARRLLPLLKPVEECRSLGCIVPEQPRDAGWVTQFHFAFDDEPHAVEVRARRCAPGRIVTESRVLRRGHFAPSRAP
ncbi:MAG TPA: hypothetical protein VM925_09110 [Labilithrix sp.]|nr:hypothetical protein [Labilithrix sp.]